MVGPGLGVDREGEDAGARLVVLHRGEEAGLAQGAREARVARGRLVGDELSEHPIVISDDVELPPVVLAEGDDLRRALGQEPVRGDLLAVEPRPPDLVRDPVAVDVGADQVRMLRPPVDEPSRHRGPLGVGVVDRRREDGGGPAPGLGADRLPPLHDAPAVVAPPFDPVDELPHLPADVAHPEVARLAVEAHLPGVPEAERPDLGARPAQVAEGVVGGDGVGLPRVGVVHVDPEDGGEEVADVLAGVEGVGRGRAGGVAGRDVEEAVGAELQAAPVVPAGEPSDQDRLARRVDARRVRLEHPEARDARAHREQLAPLLRVQRRNRCSNIRSPRTGGGTSGRRPRPAP